MSLSQESGAAHGQEGRGTKPSADDILIFEHPICALLGTFSLLTYRQNKAGQKKKNRKKSTVRD